VARLEDPVNAPMVPKTTQGKVFPRINSRMLVMSSRSPPRKIIGPLFTLAVSPYNIQSYRMSIWPALT
jgi:hypothetical protein